jgi:hypothetical protein
MNRTIILFCVSIMNQHDRATELRVLELRRYRLRPGARETLIELFDRAFIEPQEAVGMHVLGQFRDLDDPNAFVWLRGFPDMSARTGSLAAFYSGPVWAAHCDQANSTMINSDNVLLLRPITLELAEARVEHAGLVVATVCYLARGTEDAFATFFEASVRPALQHASARVIATLLSEQSPNGFPRLPVREGENVFGGLSTFPSLPAYETHLAVLTRTAAWIEHVLPEIERRSWRPNEVSRLTAKARSRLRG